MWISRQARKDPVKRADPHSTEDGSLASLHGMTKHQPPNVVAACAATLAMVALSTLAGLAVVPRWGATPVDMLYLPAVLASAALFGRAPSLTAAALSALAYNYFFVAPLHSFRIDRPEDLMTIAILLIVAIVTSQLAAAMRAQGRLAASSAARNATIAGVARKLLSCSTAPEIGAVASLELASLFACNAALLSADGAVLGRAPEIGPLSPSDMAAAAVAIETGGPAGRGAPRLNPADWLFYPVRGETASIAAMGLAREDGATAVAPEQLPLLTNLLDQVALALARAALEAEMRDVDAMRERDRLRGALLSSVGHDLRTPLTAISAAAAELRVTCGDAALVGTIETETGTLERYIANLLDMARIEAGGVRVKREPTDLVDAVAAAVRDLTRRLGDRPPRIELDDDLPLVAADPELLHHMLINLIDNAARHGGGAIRIQGARCGASVRLTVEDSGPGLPAPASALFARFGQIAGSDRSGGAGLGLAIVKELGDAMSVKVTAANRADAPGARFELRFPESFALDVAVDARPVA